jgi:hypothetical protein
MVYNQAEEVAQAAADAQSNLIAVVAKPKLETVISHTYTAKLVH